MAGGNKACSEGQTTAGEPEEWKMEEVTRHTVRAKLHPEVQKNGRWQEVTRHAVRAKLQPEIQENVQRMAKKKQGQKCKKAKIKAPKNTLG